MDNRVCITHELVHGIAVGVVERARLYGLPIIGFQGFCQDGGDERLTDVRADTRNNDSILVHLFCPVTSPNAASISSISFFVLCRCRFTRRRSLPSGTDGLRMARTSNPRFCNCSAVLRARSLPGITMLCTALSLGISVISPVPRKLFLKCCINE